MAGEGDNPYGGDYFQIERRNSGIYESLSHSSNTTTNFFNSTINTSNPKNPDLLNNTGLDIVMFDLDNTGNVYINNDQTSTTFRYGSTRDSYIIFNVTFAVEAYVPEFEGIVTNTFVNGNPPVNGDSLDPNENSDYLIEIKNTGTEAIDDFVLTIPLPDSVNPSDLDINYNLYAPLNATTNPNVPFFDASLGSNGSIVWNLDTLPLPSDPDLVLADISFTLTVTADCTILNNPNFDPNVSVNGTVSGVGNVSNVSFTNDLIRGYEATGLCTGQVIPAPIVIPIDYTDYVNEPPTASNPTTINVECVGDIPAPNIDVVTDEADNSGIAPIVAFVSDVSDGNSCPETITRTYSITDDCDNSINVVQEIIINITTSPTVPANDNSTVECLADATQPTAPTVTDVCGNNIIPVITENADPVCEGDKIYTFTYTDCAGNISVYTFTYTLGLLTFTLPANGLQTVNNLANAVTPTPPTVTDNCGNDIIPSGPTVSNTPDCQGSIIYTYTYTDCAGNTQDWLFTYTINLTPFTVPANDGRTHLLFP